MKVAFATPELLSLVRRTYLAEISEYLPRTLAKAGTDVMVFLPYCKDVDSRRLSGCKLVGSVEVPDGKRTVKLDLHKGLLGEVPVVLVDHPKLFRDRHPYGDEDGPYKDNWRRYAIFARAVLAAFKVVSYKPDVIHCLDWSTGLIPAYHTLEILGRKDHHAGRAGTYFGVHNLAMQGSFERRILPEIGIPHSLFQAIEGVELGGKVNYLKAGAEFATVIGTHSPTQVQKIQDAPRGDGLEETFRRRKKEVIGVMSGIDYRQWNPQVDPLLTQTFGPGEEDIVGKRKCKSALQNQLKLEKSPRTPLLTIIGSFDSDNGFDILSEALTPMLERNLQLVLMGPGNPEILERMHTIEQTFTGSCRVIEGYNINTLHLILAGADCLILPAHHHPTNSLCAIGMRYGVVPLCFSSSGLEDTVNDLGTDEKNGNGMYFNHYTSEGLVEGVDAVRTIYKRAADWKTLQRRCLEMDFSWEASAANYLKAYRRVVRRARGTK